MDNYYELHLTTSRIQTKPVEKKDALPWAEFFESEEAIEYFKPLPYSTNIEKSSYWINRQLTRYSEKRFGLHAVCDIESGSLMGLCGLLLQDVDGKAEIEVGYHFIKKFWGNGYGPEAARLFINYVFQNGISDSVISIIDVRNLRSQKVAEKNGLKIDNQTKWMDSDVIIYRIDEESFSKQF